MTRRTIVDYSRPMPAGFTLAGPWTPAPARPSTSADRCEGSLQLTMTTEPGPCPVCAAVVAIVPLDGRSVLVEHRPRRDDALPMSLFG